MGIKCIRNQLENIDNNKGKHTGGVMEVEFLFGELFKDSKFSNVRDDESDLKFNLWFQCYKTS